MNTNIYFFIIAGFSIKIVFHPEEGAKNMKSPDIVNKILKYYNNFRLEDKKSQTKFNFTINFIHKYFTKLRVKTADNKIVHLVGIIEEKNKSEYVTTYQISFSHFQRIIRDLIRKLIVREGFFLHASAVALDSEAFIFAGRSGAGKSTAIKLLKSHFQPLADDFLAVRMSKQAVYLYQTPFIEDQKGIIKRPDRYKVKAIFFLKQSKSCKITKISDFSKITNFLLSEVCSEDTGLENNLKLLFKFVAQCQFYYMEFPKRRTPLIDLINSFNIQQGSIPKELP